MPESYIPLDSRRKAVVIVFAAIAVISVVAVVSDILEIRLMDRFAAGEIVSDADATANDDRQALVGIVQFAALIAGAIAFIRWLHAAYKNVDVVEPSERRYGHGWAIGSWFVPILSVWRPKQIVNDVWRAGAPDRSNAGPGALLLVWWLAFVISNLDREHRDPRRRSAATRRRSSGTRPPPMRSPTGSTSRERSWRSSWCARRPTGSTAGPRPRRPRRRPPAGAGRRPSDRPACPPRSLRGPR